MQLKNIASTLLSGSCCCWTAATQSDSLNYLSFTSIDDLHVDLASRTNTRRWIAPDDQIVHLSLSEEGIVEDCESNLDESGLEISQCDIEGECVRHPALIADQTQPILQLTRVT